MRVVIVEPNGAKAGLLDYFCTCYWGFQVVAVEKTGGEGVAAVSRTKPDLVLAALTPVDLCLADFILRLRKSAPASKLVLLATQCNDYLLHLIGRSEYHGFVYEPDESLHSLGHAIECVRRGSRFVSPRLAQAQRALRLAPAAFPKLLSNREQEVLVCIAHSLSDEEIALQLGCSAGTALSHRRKLMHKLDIHSTPKLIRYCLDAGFNSVPPLRRGI